MAELLEVRIRERAHLIWENEGRPDGRATEHWLKAAAQIASETAAPKPARAAKARPAAKVATADRPAAEARKPKRAAASAAPAPSKRRDVK